MKYVVNIDSSMFDGATWYSVDDASCPFGSSWVFNIQGSGAMNFEGGDFPGIGERIVFNVLGSGRTINVLSRVNGNILAPQNTLQQNGGVTAALVIVGDITNWQSGVNPSCVDLQQFSYVLVSTSVNLVGSSSLQVADFNIAKAGDAFTNNGVQYTITSRVVSGDQTSIVIDQPLKSEIASGTQISFNVDPNQPRGADSIVTQENSASSVMACIVLTFIALLF